ncbi:MAG: aldehyde dehydrogenase [Bacteroidaceae bacterium]|nr:aldehyde dehydrogenase [Bacteroidaceae bacterium]
MTIENTSKERIQQILLSQRQFFRTGTTLSVKFRKEQLRKLKSALNAFEKPLADALWTDLHKSYQEAYLTEIGLVKAEIKEHLHHVGRWARRRRKRSPLTLFPASSYIVSEPLGQALIVSPWNYPVQLLLNPLVGAISAGCTAVLKPSPYVPNVSAVLEQMIRSVFNENYVAVVQGNRDVNKELFSSRWDIIFFTGSPALGRKVMAASAENLTPVVLELGGKSPCIIDSTANLKIAARRVAWGKTLNAGQTCIAPDYILIHEDVKEEFIRVFAAQVEYLHGKDIKESQHFVRLVSDKAFERVTGYLKDGTIVYGGRTDSSDRFIEPTLLDNVSPDAPVMTDEIFGPIFPLITISPKDGSFKDQVEKFITDREKPLAFYYFGREKDGWDLIQHTSSGGGCINDTIMHIANSHIPFGGVGNSGMGHYHGKLSFDAFTHQRSIVKAPTWIDLPVRYMPYKFFAIIKRMM